VPLTTLLNLVGGITSYNSIEAIASDNYTWALTYDQATAGNFTTYDPVTGNPVQHSQPLTAMLAYYKDDVNLTSEDGPLRLVVVGPEGLLTDSKLWVKLVTTLKVVGGPPSHDVAITNVTSYKTVVGQGYGLNVTVAVADLGSFKETFNVTVYANSTPFSLQNVTLSSGDSMNITYPWNTTGLVYGSYNMSAYSWPVPGENDTTNNAYSGGWVVVTIPGDLNGDFAVGLSDLVILAKAYGSKLGNPNWNPNADIDSNGAIGLTDLVILATHYGQHHP
jgi:hypothetical protein